MLHDLPKNIEGKITAVGKLEGTDASLITSLHHLAGRFSIRMVKHRNNAGIRNYLKCLKF